MKKNEKNFTELVFILDRSGSMGGLESDTVGGFNAMIEKQRTAGGDVLVTTVLFDDKVEMLHDRVPLEDIRPITEKEYYVRGCTALLDAVGSTVKHIGGMHKKCVRPEKTVFVITTDGLENASAKYTYDKVKKLIEKKKEKHNWEFIFLGANIDAAAEAGRLGINADKAVKFKSDPRGTRLNYRVLGEALCAVRKCGDIPEGWADEIAEYQKA